MRFEVLGFAGAAPLAGACPSYVVASGDTTVLLDCGPGTLERLWRRELLGELDAIVVSHMHVDHILDLLLLAGEVGRSLLGRRLALHVPRGDGPRVLDGLDAVFPRGRETGGSRFAAAYDVHEYDEHSPLAIGGLRFTFAPTAHQQPCFAARVSDGGTTVVYGADGSPSDAIEQLGAGADLLVLEATVAEDAAAAARYGHMTALQAGEVAARAGARRLLLTHLMPGASDELVTLAARGFDGPVALAHEGWSVELPYGSE